MSAQETPEIPERIRTKIDALQEEVQALIQQADAGVIALPYKGLSFRYTSSVPRDILTDDERAQSICFVTRYDALPERTRLIVRPDDRGNYYIRNFGELRLALNEYRPVLMNQQDSLYYGRIHSFCRQKLTNEDQTKDMVIRVINEDEKDVTKEFVTFLDQKTKAIRKIISALEFGYIYNGILQHSDHRYSKRYLEDYAKGDLNYIFLKHTLPLEYIKHCLFWHHRLINALTFPSLGPL